MRRQSQSTSRLVLAAAPMLIAACHWVAGPPDGRDDGWTYCDDYACYFCTPAGCDYAQGEDQCAPGTVSTFTGARWQCLPQGRCATSSQCDTGFVCTAGRCVPGRLPCSTHAACGDGSYCLDGACQGAGLCSTDSDCAVWGINLECDTRGSCVPREEAPPPACQSSTACTSGFCLDGRCGSCTGTCGDDRSTCQLAKHCGEGRTCLDGQCTGTCVGSTDCGAGQECQGSVCVGSKAAQCTKSAECTSGRVCVNNQCHQDCTVSGTCGSSNDTCAATISLPESSATKICVADTAARPECTMSKDCVGGEVCVNAVCRTVCAVDDDCAACPDGPVCGPGGFCMTSAEAKPECTTNNDCPAGAVCLDARCLTL